MLSVEESDLQFLDFIVNRLFMKSFRTDSTDVINGSRTYYSRLRRGRLLCFGRVIFFRPPIFGRPWADFRETLPHNAECSEIVYLLGSFHTLPPNKFEGRKPPSFTDFF